MISLIASIILVLTLIIQIVYLLRGKEEKITPFLISASALLLLIEIIYRSIQIDFPALTNMFEALTFFAFSALAALALLTFQKKLPYVLQFGGTLVAGILVAIASSPIAPSHIKPPIPALQSNWLVLHVSFAIIGEAFFLVSFVAAICYLFSKKNKDIFERITTNSIIIGYPIYTSGAIIFGAIWASSAWGSFWSWDPKEVWALITWFVYTIYLHGKFTNILKGKALAWTSIIGFLFTLFTLFGVNYLLSGLHSYG